MRLALIKKTKFCDSTINRFMSFVKKTDSCWIWDSIYLNKCGYGQFHYGKYGCQLAHRISYRLFKGSIPHKAYVLHTCDNRKCVNPDHLYLGDSTKNIQDRQDRKRHARNEFHGKHKLDWKQVQEIRDRYKPWPKHLKGNPDGYPAIARDYDVSEHTIYAIVNKWTWRPDNL